jgi:lysophospholipase L1-like esterase
MAQPSYIALGDSLTAGRGDLDKQGQPIGWARRLSGLLGDRTGVAYEFTNLAVDQATISDVLANQMPVLLGKHPELVTISTGINDIRGAFSKDEYAARIDGAFADAITTGATVATMTLPNIVANFPIPKEMRDIARGLMVELNDAIRCAAHVHGVLLIDSWYADEVAEPAFWSADGMHPNAHGHQLIAGAFADLLCSSAVLSSAAGT